MSSIAAKVALPLSLAWGLVAFSAFQCLADDGRSPPGQPAARMLGSLSCASASCHGSQDPRPQTGSSSRQEYHRWLEGDPHAGAARTIGGEMFQRILTALAGDDESLRTAMVARCAACHDPQGLAAAERDAAVLKRQAAGGIGCESCHGPAEHWLARHYEQGISREELRGLGMVDTKDLAVRAAQCAGCHVGDEQRDMNHDMIAAGHPPLRFELSAYHDLIRRKHWSDAERIQTPHFKARLWAAGQVAAAEASLALLQSRAARAAADERLTPWPEFSEYDCFACHQRLRPHIAATSGRGGSAVALKAATPGIPGWQPWNLAMIQRLRPSPPDAPVAALRDHLGRSLLADPAQTARLAAIARRWVHDHALAESTDAITGRQLVELVQGSMDERQSWAASTQQLLALQAAYLAWRDEARKLRPSVQLVSAPAAAGFPAHFDTQDEQMQARLAALRAALRFGSPRFEWPAFDWQGLPPMKDPPALADQRAIAQELERLAAELRELLADSAQTP